MIPRVKNSGYSTLQAGPPSQAYGVVRVRCHTTDNERSLTINGSPTDRIRAIIARLIRRAKRGIVKSTGKGKTTM